MLVVIPEGEYRNWQVDTRLANSFSYYYCRLCSFLFFSIIFYYENTKQCPFRLSSLNYLNTLEANAIHLLFCLTLIILICSNANNNKFVVLPLLPNEYDININQKNNFFFLLLLVWWCVVLLYGVDFVVTSSRPTAWASSTLANNFTKLTESSGAAQRQLSGQNTTKIWEMNVLQREMDRSKRQLDTLCENLLDEADGKVSAHKAYLKQTEAQIAELKNSLTRLENEALKVRDDISNERLIEKRLEDERENLRRQDTEMPSRLAELHTRENKIKNELLAASNDVSERARLTNQVNNDLTYGIIAFKKRLGLDFQRLGANRLQLNFTNIDPNSHSRVFSFSIHVDEADKYNIISCSPAVEGTEQLLSALNASNDFSAFVRGMRVKFRALCS